MKYKHLKVSVMSVSDTHICMALSWHTTDTPELFRMLRNHKIACMSHVDF